MSRVPPPTSYWKVVEAVRSDGGCTLCGRHRDWLFRWHHLYLCDDVCIRAAIRRFGPLFAPARGPAGHCRGVRR
jgi:hypothetical protein